MDEQKLRVELLGPVRAWVSGGEVDLGGGMAKAVFAALALQRGRSVPRAALVAALWAGQPPASADGLISTYVAGLRRAIEPGRSGGGFVLLSSSREGYRLALPDEYCDVAVFEARLQLAKDLLPHDPGASAAVAAEALVLRRGMPLTGLPGPFAAAECERLTQAYLDAAETRAEALITTGKPAEAATELNELSEQWPLREHANALLRTALNQVGRPAEAHVAYQRLQRGLGRDTGSPGVAPHQVTDESGRPAPAAESGLAGSGVPAQLPHDSSRFTGRSRELSQLTRLLSTDRTNAAPPMVILTGAVGIGKTALAVHAAHRLGSAFPDGHLFIDLCGFDPELPPRQPGDVLVHCLHGLGVGAEHLPPGEEELAALMRSVLAERRVLLVLDNAVSSTQVRPLLPGASTSAVLVTSRNRLAGLVIRDGFQRIELPLLSSRESVEYLRLAVGRDRLRTESAAAADLASLCGHLPLALSMVAERVAGTPAMTLADMRADLADERERLDRLGIEDEPASTVRAAFSWSYHALKPATARFFRSLGLHPQPEFTSAGAAALTGRSAAEARILLRDLAAGHLVEVVAHDRYRLHQLMRLYARDLGAEDGEAPGTSGDRACGR